MEPPALAPEVSISHLLLNEHLLHGDARVVDRVDLPAHGASLVAAGQGPPAVASRPHSLASARRLSLPVQTPAEVVVCQVLSSFVPHKAC